MNQVKISSRFQVVIPGEVRETLGLVPGQHFQALTCRDRIELVPARPIDAMRGFPRGMDTRFERGPDREIRLPGPRTTRRARATG